MNPENIILRADRDGVKLALSTDGTIKATGDRVAIARWLPIIRANKPEIMAFLRGDGLPENGHQADDHLRLDSLILQYGILARTPPERLAEMLEIRRRMAPFKIQESIDSFQKWIADLTAKEMTDE